MEPYSKCSARSASIPVLNPRLLMQAPDNLRQSLARLAVGARASDALRKRERRTLARQEQRAIRIEPAIRRAARRNAVTHSQPISQVAVDRTARFDVCPDRRPSLTGERNLQPQIRINANLPILDQIVRYLQLGNFIGREPGSIKHRRSATARIMPGHRC